MKIRRDTLIWLTFKKEDFVEKTWKELRKLDIGDNYKAEFIINQPKKRWWQR